VFLVSGKKKHAFESGNSVTHQLFTVPEPFGPGTFFPPAINQ